MQIARRILGIGAPTPVPTIALDAAPMPAPRPPPTALPNAATRPGVNESAANNGDIYTGPTQNRSVGKFVRIR